MRTFAFESYGVRVRIESNRSRVLNRARSIATKSLLGNLSEIEPHLAEHVFTFKRTPECLSLDLDGEFLGDNSISKGFFNYFESRVRVLVAEHAKDLVFMHAGAVAWKGKAVLFPANSYQGKTSLVAALVRRGAVYYSDDYAILDKNGFVHPFARPLSIRVKGRSEIRANRHVSSLGGVAGEVPLPVEAVILTKFRKNSRWNPKILSPGNGLLRMIEQTIPLQANPEFSLSTLKLVANRAIIARSSRPDLELCVNEIVKFIDRLLL